MHENRTHFLRVWERKIKNAVVQQMHTFKEERKRKYIYIYIHTRRARTGSVRAQRSERSALATGRSQLPVAGGRGGGMKPGEGRRVPSHRLRQPSSVRSKRFTSASKGISPPPSIPSIILFSFASPPPHPEALTHPSGRMQTVDADDGGLGLPALGLAVWIWAADGTCGGSLPALPSRGDVGSWVQFGRAEREIPVGSRALGWMRMGKTQKWDGDGAGMRMELRREGMGRNPPASGRRRG